ncbi:Scr1 family TA system antitoxin-like transcriptional regulator [Streptacidiphilus sp. PB12-B1b]|uniref:helix-turn-helix domain-containing protein n=1 Tax=Streptacidiphilus sp. PB12-B1b TaxID=2705012 RepID=UPI001CDBC9BE|nr:Scr1 family TA system antitoxin-like transcriptional regulator [Streptacidiphilus sp. PB12-B1b]
MSRRNGESGEADTAAELFGMFVRRRREAAGYSQVRMAQELHYDRTRYVKVETGKQVPALALVRAMDVILKTEGLIEEMWHGVNWYPELDYHPDWFKRRADMDAKLVELLEYQTQLIPGLLQTTEYAHALFTRATHSDGTTVNDQVKGRISRQTRFLEPDGPTYIVLLDESCIRNIIGSRDVMYRQLKHLIAVGELPNIRIQIIPYGLSHVAVPNTPMSLIAMPDDTRYVYSESLDGGHFSEHPNVLAKHQRTYDLLRADALPARESAAVIREAMRGHINMNNYPSLNNAPWRKSSYSGDNGGNCIEAAPGFLPGAVPIRDSKDPNGPALVFPTDAFASFVAAVKAGEFPTA